MWKVPAVQENTSSSSSSDEQEAVDSFLIVPVMESVDPRQQCTEAPVVPELSLLPPDNHDSVAGLPQIVPQGDRVGNVDLAEAVPRNFLSAIANLQKQMDQKISLIYSSLIQLQERLERVVSRVDILEQQVASGSLQSPTDREVPQMEASNTSNQGRKEPFQWLSLAAGANPGFRVPTNDQAAARVDHSPFAPPPDLPRTGNRSRPCFPRLPRLPRDPSPI